MKILLDECIDTRFSQFLQGHEAKTVQDMNWRGVQNGRLLELAAHEGFELFVTVDRNLVFQQNVRDLPLAVAVLSASSNRLVDLSSLAPKLLEEIKVLQSRTLLTIR